MRLFVAGATGAVGSRLLPLLGSAGHSVVGLTRTAGKEDVIRQLGAEPAVADALNRAAIVEAVARAKPDVIVHEMTSLGAANDLRRFDRCFAVTNRLRTEGLQNLLAQVRRSADDHPVGAVRTHCDADLGCRTGPRIACPRKPAETAPAVPLREAAAGRRTENQGGEPAVPVRHMR